MNNNPFKKLRSSNDLAYFSTDKVGKGGFLQVPGVMNRKFKSSKRVLSPINFTEGIEESIPVNPKGRVNRRKQYTKPVSTLGEDIKLLLSLAKEDKMRKNSKYFSKDQNNAFDLTGFRSVDIS
mmetsp:Transcript_8165/g.7244  ORF Transcript_8165/g.7244 Transcript_8165/m.7244 type:complete len:123 (+) Transcript_8165:115-483(+)